MLIIQCARTSLRRLEGVESTFVRVTKGVSEFMDNRSQRLVFIEDFCIKRAGKDEQFACEIFLSSISIVWTNTGIIMISRSYGFDVNFFGKTKSSLDPHSRWFFHEMTKMVPISFFVGATFT